MATDLNQRPKLFAKEVTDVPNFVIPKSVDNFSNLWVKARISSIHELEQGYFGSGSNVTQTQYLAFRIIHAPSPLEPESLDQYLGIYGLDDVWADATHRVAQSTEYKAYVDLIRRGISVIDLPSDHQSYPGSFKPVKRVQEQIAPVHDVNITPEHRPRQWNQQLYKVAKSNTRKEKEKVAKLRPSFAWTSSSRRPSQRDSARNAKELISA
ncbi:hypothetical protein F66182_15450 [Fusarium sp. NRRL 66182]|nr:hypothetical protein F66182_15450 [Fusarium sp. NRRL 66182]